MLEQGYLTHRSTKQSIARRCPPPRTSRRRSEQTIEGVDAGYFTSWVQQQVIERYGAARAFDGGLRIKTTLDLELQRAAEQAVNNYLAYARRPHGLARRDRKLDRRGARDGRRAQLRRKPVQPRHRAASASRAPRSRRSTWPPRSRTASRPNRCGPPSRRRSSCPTPTARKSSSCTTTKATTRAPTR